MTSFYLANPAAAWALLGLPAVLLIHLLQQKTRRLPVSTLFLLQNLAPESVPGRSLRRIRSSVPLFLQLLMVLLLAWILAEPRWLNPKSSQTVVIVLDSSASMSAFREKAREALAGKLSTLEKGVSRTEWVLLESDPKRQALYRGTEREKMLDAMENWHPDAGFHDWAPAWELAQAVRGGQGRILAVSDHDMELPAGAGLLAVGEPLANAGFSGVAVRRENGEVKWKAVVQNHSDLPARRSWRVETGQAASKESRLELGPRAATVLSGTFPAGEKRLELVLEADEFALDDRLPMLQPEPKPFGYFMGATGEAGQFFRRLAEGTEGLSPLPDPAKADLAVAGRRLGQPVRENGNGILFYSNDRTDARYNLQPVVADGHDLVRDLNWQGLLSGGPGLFEMTPADRVLLWQGGRPLVLLRENSGAGILIFNFDFEHSNAARLPSFVILVNRFLELVRSGKNAAWRENFESNQPLRLAASPPAGLLELAGPEKKESVLPEQFSSLRAPAPPGYFTLSAGKNLLLEGAVHFGDPREADLSKAASVERLLEVSSEALRQNTEADPMQSVWILLLGSLLVLSWWWQSPLRKGGGRTA